MEEVYSTLNNYLNDICNYMQETNPFFLKNILKIIMLNDSFYDFIDTYNLNKNVIKNHLTYYEVFMLGREIIEKIDKNYLDIYDNLIQSGELDFGYEGEYDVSVCHTEINDKGAKHLIDIAREFNYNDVISLVHEFIHYINGKTLSLNRNYLTEFLSIYFELFANDYLLKKGINSEEIGSFDRLVFAKRNSNSLFKYEMVFLAYLKFGNIDENSIDWVRKYFPNLKEDVFNRECTRLCEILSKIEKDNKEIIKKNPKIRGEILSKEFIAHDYRYLLGTLCAVYAKRYCDFDKIVYLNNHIDEYNHLSVYEILLGVQIDVNAKDFVEKLFKSIDEYICFLESFNKNDSKKS